MMTVSANSWLHETVESEADYIAARPRWMTPILWMFGLNPEGPDDVIGMPEEEDDDD